MTPITAEIRAWIDENAGSMELAADEYIDPADGLIHCKTCGGQRQTIVPRFGKSGYFMPSCVCPCQAEADRRRREAEEQRNRMESIKRRKAQGLQDRYLYDYTFANDNGQNPLMKKARAYVEHWREAYRDNTGLLLFGDVGTGKSFFAGCIANALLDRDIPVLMTNFPSILTRLTLPMRESMTAYWNGAPLSSLPGRTSRRKTLRRPRPRLRRLYPKNETENRMYGRFPRRHRRGVRERSI